MSINGHSLFENISFPLSSPHDFSSNYKTVIIGPNGTGKSTILSCIADALTIECSERKIKSLTGLTYAYDLEIQRGEEVSLISSSQYENDKKIFGGGKILAISSTPNDRFPFLAKNSVRKSEQYAYLGLKSASNNIFFANMKERMLRDMLIICKSNRRVKSALSVLSELGFNSKFSISLVKGSNFSIFENVLKGEVSIKPASGSSNFKNAAFNGFVESDFYKQNSKNIKETIATFDTSIGIKANLSTIKRNKIIFNNLTLTSKLVEAKILAISSISIFSNDNIDLHQASSGEFNILRIFLSIIAHVEDNSIILVDEPEVSLHPNWQIEFLSLLDKALATFKGCHSLIATHSHFILSNLDGLKSTILALNFDKDSKAIAIDALDVDSFGWSPEHTLYQVFGVTGFRNKYLEMDLRIIVDYMSNNLGNLKNFKEAFSRVEKFNITEVDPIFQLLKNAKALIGKKR